MTLDSTELEQKYAYPTGGEPWLRSNFVTTLDGAAYAADGRSGSLGGPEDTRVFALLRSLADVIIVGAGTARAEGYQPVKPTEIDTELRSRLGLEPLPPIAVVSKSLNIPVELIAPGQIVITTTDAPTSRIESLREHVEVITAGVEEIELAEVKAALARKGHTRMLCEGGPSLHAALVEQDLLDELCLSIAPVLAAGAAPRIAHGVTPTELPMTLGHSLQAGDLLLTRWVRNRD